MKKKRFILIGDDGMMLSLVRKFKGQLPNISRLMDSGVSLTALSCAPEDTPTNWTTIATGAMTRTHGIRGFRNQYQDKKLGDTAYTFNSGLNRSQYVWEAGEKNGRKSILLNYPMTSKFPSNVEKSIVLGGIFDPSTTLFNAACYVTKDMPEMTNTRSIELAKAAGWADDAACDDDLECAVDVSGGQKLSWSEKGIELIDEKGEETAGASLYVLVSKSSSDVYDSISIHRDKTGKTKLAELKAGQWSEPLVLDVDEQNGKASGALRFKLQKLSPSAEEMVLIHTPCYRVFSNVFCSEEDRSVVDGLGPFLEHMEVFWGMAHNNGWLPPQDLMEIPEIVVDDIIDVAKTIASSTDWDMLFVQIHLQDGLTHALMGRVDEGNHFYDRKQADEVWWPVFLKAHQITDKLVGGLVEGCADENTVVGLISDHGGMPYNKKIDIITPLIDAGLMILEDKGNGVLAADRNKSKALHFSGGLWVNANRPDSMGDISENEYEAIVDSIVDALTSIRDSETGLSPIAEICRRDAARMKGEGAELCPDVTISMKPGYTHWAPGVVGGDWNTRDTVTNRAELEEFEKNKGFAYVRAEDRSGGHSIWSADADYLEFSHKPLWIVSGPGIKKNYTQEEPIRLTDVAPTIAHIMGFSMENTDGGIVSNILE